MQVGRVVKHVHASRKMVVLGLLLVWLTAEVGFSQTAPEFSFEPATFTYLPGPADNPLKGLVPYQRPHEGRFPYSMEFNYLPLSAIVTGPNQYSWEAFEAQLNDIASRGRQTVTRIFLEYPGKEDVIPKFLVDGGLKVHRYVNTNTAPLPPAITETPDYEDPRLRKVLVDFVHQWGKRYDGDPRLAYITAGLLGTWGEWHTYPQTELWASQAVQKEILDAYQAAFQKTPVLLRYPAGPGDDLYHDSTTYPFGYHDDSFAYATLPTARPEDDWFFWPKMKAAGLTERWKTAPIGGEIRPEVWGCCFDPRPCTAADQSFDECRDLTHVTWLMDTGLNREKPSAKRYSRAIEAVGKMGYDLTVTSSAGHINAEGSCELKVTLKNVGIAPFYHVGWTAVLECVDPAGRSRLIPTDWRVRGLLPGQSRTYEKTLGLSSISDQPQIVSLAMPNPMASGRPLRFANQGCDATSGRLVIGKLNPVAVGAK